MDLHKRNISGFTLVELLIVIGIVAVLIAILLPALSRANRQAQQIACQSNVRQVCLAAQMYAQEQKVYVGYLSGPSPKDRKELLYPYLKQGRSNADVAVNAVWHCVSNRFPETQTGYGFNMHLNFQKLTKIRKWSETVAVVDSGRLDNGQPTLITHCFPPSRPTATNAVRPEPRHHNSTVNVGFVDGHVEVHKMTPPFYPSATWTGNGVTDPNHPDYKDHIWDLK